MKAQDRPIIRLEGVCRSYPSGGGEVRALRELSLDIAPGDFCAIMGPSGSGKSTLLNLLGCLDRPTSGRYLLSGREVACLSDDELSLIRLRHLGFIFQGFNLIAQLDVQENIELPLYYLDLEPQAAATKAAELAAMVGLSERLRHRPNQLSGGEQQRVAIARALAADPDILLADEPTGNLDTATGERIMELLLEQNRRGRTIIMVTHEPEIAAHAHYRLHMRDGRVLEREGRP